METLIYIIFFIKKQPEQMSCHIYCYYVCLKTSVENGMNLANYFGPVAYKEAVFF